MLLLIMFNLNAREKIAPPVVPAFLCNVQPTRLISPASSLLLIAPPPASCLLLLFHESTEDVTIHRVNSCFNKIIMKDTCTKELTC